MNEVITIGEPMVLFAADTVGPLEDIYHYTKFLSGAEVNVCIGLTRLNHKVSYITKLGKDPLGTYIKKFLNHEKIDTTYVEFDSNHHTGFQMKEKTESGDSNVVSFRKGSAASYYSCKDIEQVDFEGVKHIHVTGIFPALSDVSRKATYKFIEKAKEHGIRLSFDPNLRPKLWENREEMIRVINDLASKCDIVLPGVEEGKILVGSGDPEVIADFYLNMGSKIVIVKIGSKGAFVKTKDESYTVPGFTVDKIIDTVGAGDGFAVGVISGLLEGLQLKDAVLRGNAIGSLQVMAPGDNDGLPTVEQLKKYLAIKNNDNR